MTGTDHQPTDRPCEDCGGVVLSGVEPISAVDDPELAAVGLSEAASEWCTHLDCPSDHAVPGVWRVGVNDYTCKVCGDAPLHARRRGSSRPGTADER